MSEETREWIAGRDTLAKRLYEETGNRYWALYSLWLTNGFFKTSEWALDALRLAAVSAIAKEKKGAELSLDRELGIKPKRGGAPANKRAENDERMQWVLRFVAVIHAIYDVSKDVACEIIFHSVDFQHAETMDFKRQRAIEEECWRKTERADSEPLAWADHAIDAMREIGASQVAADARRAIWSVTYGQTLRISLDTLIAKAHRNRTKYLDLPDAKKNPYIYFLSLSMLHYKWVRDPQLPPELGLSRWRWTDPETLKIRDKLSAEFSRYDLHHMFCDTAFK